MLWEAYAVAEYPVEYLTVKDASIKWASAANLAMMVPVAPEHQLQV